MYVCVCSGFLPLKVTADDNGNYGECNGDHECGQDKPCLNHLTAEPHSHEQRGRNSIIIDMMVGGKALCVVDCEGLSNLECCKKCHESEEETCGWCSGDCDGKGKCMIAVPDRSRPLFSSCEPNARDGRTFGQCSVQEAHMLSTVVAVLLTAAAVGVMTWRVLHWVRRRHGTVLRYLHKKREDLVISARRFNLNPPSKAQYPEFFFLLVPLLLFVLYLTNLFSAQDPSCVFTHGFFLDRVNSIVLKLDTCNLRFLPAHLGEGVDKGITSPKVLFSFSKHDPAVVLSHDTCTNVATFSLLNLRSDMRKYDGYYCEVRMMVPDRIVLPELVIESIGQNLTSVRAGSMDADTPDFGLDLGPNPLKIEGYRMSVRLHNVTAKEVHVKLQHGNLFAQDLGLMAAISSATFSSKSADLVVTTPHATSMRYWQKSGNKVCITGAKGSLYLFDACDDTCALIDASGPDMPKKVPPPFFPPSRLSLSPQCRSL